MGALEELQNFVKKKLGIETKKKNDDSSKSSASPGQGTTNGIIGGFPFVNYASERINLRPFMVPRQKYTYGVEFHVNPDALLDGVSITNIKKFLTNGNLYTQLKRIDHPKPSFAVETLRSYNKYIKLPTKMEFPPASITFDDDATSITMALIKEYINFYSHSGDVGSQLLSAGNTSAAGSVRPPNFNSSFGDDSFSFDQPNVGYNHLVANDATDTPRSHMDTRPSMGLKLKPNYKRHFFNSIVIYDLGTEPNSVNIYYFYKPVITSIDHAGLDTEDRSSKVEVTVNLEYENYYFAVGRNSREVADAIELLTGIRPPDAITSDLFGGYHGAMETKPIVGSEPVSKASKNPQAPLPSSQGTLPVDPFGTPPDVRSTGDIEAEREKVRQELAAIASATSNSGSTAESEFDTARLTNKLKLLDKELNKSTAVKADVSKKEQSTPATKSATENTKKQLQTAEKNKPENAIQNDSNLKVNGKTKDQWQAISDKSTVMRDKLVAQADATKLAIATGEQAGASFGRMSKLREQETRLRSEANDQAELQRSATESVIKINQTAGRTYKPL